METRLTYPKIETLYERDPETFRVTDILRLPEFELVSHWHVTEKIDGTNVRVFLDSDGSVTFGGRTNNAQMPTSLLEVLQAIFTKETMIKTFDEGAEVVLFGEGYGGKIQSGGNYRSDPSFRLFDVNVGGWWLNWTNVQDVANKLQIQTVPVIADALSFSEAVQIVTTPSTVANEEGGLSSFVQEGIVARTDPLLFTRSGDRLLWKLKGKDFKGGKR